MIYRKEENAIAILIMIVVLETSFISWLLAILFT